MKNATTATLAILAAGQAFRVDLYAITLAGGSPTYYFTDNQLPLIVGGQVYQTGLLLKRGSLKQTLDLKVDTLQITVTPQPDNSSGPATIAGFPFLQACALRVLDGARILYSKMFLNPPTGTGVLDVTPGAVKWFQGRVNQIDLDRQSAVITVNSDIEMLNSNAPVNIFQAACTHTLFDPGCTLRPQDFIVSSSVAAGANTILSFQTNLTQANDYFTLGRITFTGGANATNPRTTSYVKLYVQTGGVISLIRPLPNIPQVGDTFNILPGCDKTTATCTARFNNLAHNRSTPFIPVVETLYDGGSTPPAATQSPGKVGTPFSSNIGQRNAYKA